jgi:hypothetical protein
MEFQMPKLKKKNDSLYKDAVESARKTLTKVYGKAPKKSTVDSVARGLVASIEAANPKLAASANGAERMVC